ncbi:hypothetical protein JK636_20220 [Clostridium sp. YIM B02515]|uniref:Uncharacterized protein n=1 Tax=Clostridium rhizosphaerae TaxID=2803861 RepID=A0ABS1TF97_9CLOT|nr:hypothetical protein [Clostridium rhizosphaerae]MBL4938041.1 hypothetical protein [Clostridium rhizosphaerae]
MSNIEAESYTLKIIEKVYAELKNIEIDCTDYIIKEKIHNLVDLVEKETLENKTIFIEMVKSKVKETRGVNSELNTYFYLLYRNLTEGRIGIKEAQTLYDMYIKEFNTK